MTNLNTTLNTRVRQAASQNADIYPNDAGFVDTIDSVVSFLEQLPTTFRFEFHPNLSPQKLGSNQGDVFLTLLKNWHGWLGFFVYSVAYKVRHLLDDIVVGLNSSRFLPVAASARGTIEQVAVFHSYFTQVSKLLQSLDNTNPKQNFPQYIVQVIDLIKILQKYAQATRFNWKSYANGDLDTFFSSWDQVDESVRQTNIMTMLDKLPQEQKGARFFYEMLCDFVHPNVGSHQLIIDKVEFIEDNKMAYTLSSMPESNELLAMTLHVISIPLDANLSLLRTELQPLLHTLASLKEWIANCEQFDVRHN